MSLEEVKKRFSAEEGWMLDRNGAIVNRPEEVSVRIAPDAKGAAWFVGRYRAEESSGRPEEWSDIGPVGEELTDLLVGAEVVTKEHVKELVDVAQRSE